LGVQLTATEIVLLILLILVSIAFGIFYYLNYMKKPDEYIWVGPGENPFSKKECRSRDSEEEIKEEE